MPLHTPTLHLICGKIAAGKSTLTQDLSRAPNTVVIAEDEWLSMLFGDQMTTLADYVRCTGKLRQVIGPHVVTLLNAGTSVVLDIPANTIATRDWMRGLLDQTAAQHQMHILDTPDHVCLDRLRQRNAKGDHPFAPTEAQFHQVSKHFVLPSQDEGFALVVHRPADQRETPP